MIVNLNKKLIRTNWYENANIARIIGNLTYIKHFVIKFQVLGITYN